MSFPTVYNVAKWKIWYSNCSTFSSNDGPWQDAPDQDVQIVMLYYNVLDKLGRPTRTVCAGNDYYYLSGSTFGSDFDDSSRIFGVVKYGKWTTDENIDYLMSLVSKDYSV